MKGDCIKLIQNKFKIGLLFNSVRNRVIFYSLGQCRHPLGPSSSSSVCTFTTRLHSWAVITGAYMIIQRTSFPKVTQVV